MNQHNFILTGCDTDSIMFKKSDGAEFSKEEQDKLLDELNTLFPEKIRWEHDGLYKTVIYVKAKNYVMDDGEEVIIKGSGLKASMKEKKLKQFINEVINLLLNGKSEIELVTLYNSYAKEIIKITDMTGWVSKKTITKAVLDPKRANEQNIKDALAGKDIQEGDKVLMFFKAKGELCLLENFTGHYDVDILLEKLFKTIKIFSTITDIEKFPNYKLKRNKEKLQSL